MVDASTSREEPLVSTCGREIPQTPTGTRNPIEGSALALLSGKLYKAISLSLSHTDWQLYTWVWLPLPQTHLAPNIDNS